MEILFTGGTGLWFLFSTGFLSATLLPGGSEANLIAALEIGDNPVWLVLTVVTVGNTLGGMTNFGLGYLLPKSRDTKPSLKRAKAWAERYGYWSLLLSWLPIVGDPLCLAAGWLKMNVWWSLAAICIGKAVRYIVLAFIVINAI